MIASQRPLVTAGTLLGIGLGGVVDGILFHQILQLHNMLTAIVPKDTIVHVEINMFWDGIFHTITWIMTVLGVIFLFRAGQRRDVVSSNKTFVGALTLGWGLFNFIEGGINHHILGLHHVVERLGLSVFDWLFLASGAVLIAVGWLAIQADAKHHAAASRAGNSSHPDRIS